jgi:hypothetical protein
MANMVYFHMAVVAVHALGGVVTYVAGLACRVGQARQLPIVPYETMGHVSLHDYRDGAGWAPDLGVPLLALNPYQLIASFEWLTAAFALLYLREASGGYSPLIAGVWLALGVLLQAVWVGVTRDYPCPMQAMVVLLLHIYSIRVCVWPYRRFGQDPEGKAPDDRHSSDGREWRVPSVAHLKRRHASTDEHAADEEIMARYDEYAITAPLLFLAVVALYLPGAPAWLVLSGFFLIAACNVWGPAVHLGALDYWRARDERATWWDYLRALLCIGSWRAPSSHRLAVLWLAWVSLLVPVAGLLYLTQRLWFSTAMPVIVTVMSWNLLVTYCLFGLIPTFVYLTNIGRARLGLILDLLNLAAKGPLPWILLYGFFGRPAGFAPCRS